MRKWMLFGVLSSVLVATLCFSPMEHRLAADQAPQPASQPAAHKLTFGFVALHGGMFDTIRSFDKSLDLNLIYFTDDEIKDRKADFRKCDVVFLQHLRSELKDRYKEALQAAKAANPAFQALVCSNEADNNASVLLGDEVKSGLVLKDKDILSYYGFNKANLERMLSYAAIKYCNRPGTPQPPLQDGPPLVFHPDYAGSFPDVKSFVDWMAGRHPEMLKRNRVIVMAHANHLVFLEPEVVISLIREFEKKGLFAVCLTDGQHAEQFQFDFKPDAIVHTCHGSELQASREKLDVPQLTALYTKATSIDEYLSGKMGLASGELQHQITSQELKGTVQPMFAGATVHGGGSEEAILPVPERIEHIVARTIAMINLRKKPASQKKVAIIYYDQEMGKGELMRGTATGMFMNGPRSMLKVLSRLGTEGYVLNRPPETEEDMIDRMKDHGRQVGVWAPEVLNRLAESGNAILIPAETYLKWFETKVPKEQQAEVIKQWGPPPGKFLVWEKDGKQYIVIPHLDLGNVVLLPQPLRGEAQTSSAINTQTHDKLTPPPHNYLATYFWLQEGFQADALIHFGTHGSEIMLPGKPEGLTQHDWCDIILGTMPNISLWIVNNVGESVPEHRRAYATIVDHLTPPLVEAELSDELKNLQSDIEKWETVEDGALKDKFLASIVRQIHDNRIDQDLHMDLSGEHKATPEEVEKVSRYLEGISNDSTPISLHILGEVPKRELLTPYLVRCAGKLFLDEFGKLIPAATGDAAATGREALARKKAEEVMNLVLVRKFALADALKSIGVAKPDALPKPVREGFELMTQMDADFQKTGNEIDGLVAALGSHFIPPGPANSPDRNPGAIPTGRNMFAVNPEEIPSPASWEIGKQLIDSMLKDQLTRNGKYPNRVAFSLSPSASYRDFGVIESQILYLMGMRPVWTPKRLVEDIEPIPADELKRPRIDVFLSARSYYRDQLVTRMRLIDKAVRLAAALDEKQNYVRQNTIRVKSELIQGGMEAGRAEILSKARMFGSAPGQNGSGWYYYLAEKTGEWNTREDLMKVYLEHSQYAYTEDMWGENAPQAYERTIQGTDVVIRSWADSVASPLSNKYTWFVDGSLAQAVKQLTGKEPEYFLADVRDAGKTRMVSAEDALAADFRVRLFNRKWIEGMMKEGYAGADQVSVHVNNALGWKIMREKSVSDDTWMEIVNVYVRDSKNLHIREWFDAQNPYAFQSLTQTLLETTRKGYWKPDDATLRELAMEYAKSVNMHGVSGGLRGGGNAPFQQFLQTVLNVPGDQKAQAVLAEYNAKRQAAKPEAPDASDKGSSTPEAAPGADGKQPEQVTGNKLTPVAEDAPKSVSWLDRLASYQGLILACGAGLVLIVLGFRFRKGMPRS